MTANLTPRWKTLRINARLDDERSAKLLQMQTSSGRSASDLLKLAIDCLHDQQRQSHCETIENLMSSEFIGCAGGPEDLSESYKQRLADDLNNKHGAR